MLGTHVVNELLSVTGNDDYAKRVREIQDTREAQNTHLRLFHLLRCYSYS